MSTWRVHRHYGFGAARIPITARAHRVAKPPRFFAGLATIWRELSAGGPVAMARRVVGQTPAFVLGLLLVSTFVVTLLRDHSDRSTVEVVMLETFEAPPVPEVVPEPEPIPEPEIAKLEPPLPPEPRVVPPEPIPEPVMAKVEPPPPPKRTAPPKPRPEPVRRPPPVMPQIAKVEPPPPPKRAERPVRERAMPTPAERPQLAMDRMAPPPDSPAPERLARAAVDRTQPTRRAPRLNAPAPAAPVFEEANPSPKRAFRVATARPAAGEKPKAMPGLAPAPVRPTAEPPPGPRPHRARAPAPTRRAPQRAPAPAMAAAPVPDSPHHSAPTPTRVDRQAPRATPTRRAARPAAAPARAPRMPTSPPPALASRSARNTLTPAQPSGSGDRPGLAGVPLGDLAACMSDREEDRLKQAVVAAVKTQDECVSRKGTYRFIETKNLNAFLMWIDRKGSGAAGDRCEELRNALDCLQQSGLRAAR